MGQPHKMKVISQSKQLSSVQNAKKPVKTSIICTIGPRSSSCEMLEKLIQEGMTVARFNLARASHSDIEQGLDNLRKVLEKTNGICATLVALKGANLRTGKAGLKEGQVVQIQEKQIFTFYCDDASRDIETTDKSAYINCNQLPLILKEGMVFSVDGQVEFELHTASNTSLLCIARNSGPMGAYKRVHLPADVDLPKTCLSAIFKQDLEDARWALKTGFDFVANASVLLEDEGVVGELFGADGLRLFDTVFSSRTLQRAYAMQRDYPSYVAAVVLMRGRLATDVPPEAVPLAQRRLCAHAAQIRIPFIISEQCLDSMINQPIPSRADATDIAAAVYGGVSGIVLTGETARGKYPVEAVQRAASFIRQVEEHINYRQEYLDLRAGVQTPITSDASLGSSAAFVVQVTDDEHVARRRTLLRARIVYLVEKLADVQVPEVLARMRDDKICNVGDSVVVLIGTTCEFHTVE